MKRILDGIKLHQSCRITHMVFNNITLALEKLLQIKFTRLNKTTVVFARSYLTYFLRNTLQTQTVSTSERLSQQIFDIDEVITGTS